MFYLNHSLILGGAALALAGGTICHLLASALGFAVFFGALIVARLSE